MRKKSTICLILSGNFISEHLPWPWNFTAQFPLRCIGTSMESRMEGLKNRRTLKLWTVKTGLSHLLSSQSAIESILTGFTRSRDTQTRVVRTNVLVCFETDWSTFMNWACHHVLDNTAKRLKRLTNRTYVNRKLNVNTNFSSTHPNSYVQLFLN